MASLAFIQPIWNSPALSKPVGVPVRVIPFKANYGGHQLDAVGRLWIRTKEIVLGKFSDEFVVPSSSVSASITVLLPVLFAPTSTVCCLKWTTAV
jgi:hypothetical protein